MSQKIEIKRYEKEGLLHETDLQGTVIFENVIQVNGQDKIRITIIEE